MFSSFDNFFSFSSLTSTLHSQQQSPSWLILILSIFLPFSHSSFPSLDHGRINQQSFQSSSFPLPNKNIIKHTFEIIHRHYYHHIHHYHSLESRLAALSPPVCSRPWCMIVREDNIRQVAVLQSLIERRLDMN